jgi:HK97 family phage portal protein
MEYKFLPALMGRLKAGFGKSDSAVSHAISGSTAATAGPYGGAFSTFGGGWDVEQSVQMGYERVIWVLRCVDAIASNQAKLKFIQRHGDIESGKITKNEDLSYTLNRRANQYETAKQFRYRLSGQLLLSKRGAFIEKQTAPSGKKRLHLLPPQNVEPIPDPDTFVAGYRLMTANQGEVILEREKVIWVRTKPHPIDPYLQVTPLTAAGLAIETDYLARLFNRNFLLNDGRPGLLIGVSGQMSPRDAEELKDRFSGTPHSAGRTSVIEADGVTVNDLSATPRDLQWLEAITGTKSDILLAFGTPESVLGNASGRTYDNADAEKEVWWEETMLPHCDAIAAALDELTGSYDDDEYLTYDYDAVDVLQRRKRARQQAAMDSASKGMSTLDEMFKATGRDPWDVPATRVLLMPNGLVIGKDDADVEAVAQLPVVGVEQQADIAKEAQRGAEMGAALGQRNFGNMISARATRIANGEDSYGGPRQEDYALAKQHPRTLEAKVYRTSDEVPGDYWTEDWEEVKAHPYEALRAEAEANFGLFLTDWSNFQEQTIMGRLNHRKALLYTRHWTGEPYGRPRAEGKALNAGYIVDTNRWADGIEQKMAKLMEKVALDGLKAAAEEMETSGITRTMHSMGRGSASGRSALLKVFGGREAVQRAVSGLLVPFSDVVQTAAANQSDRIAKVISDMDAEGASMSAIKQRVSGMMSTRGSWKTGLATAMTTSLIEAARHAAFSEAGPIVNKFWNTVEDEKVRPTHEAIDGEEIPIGQSFKVGKWRMDYPGDPKGGPEERFNCRCYTDYAISPDAEELYDLTAGEY